MLTDLSSIDPTNVAGLFDIAPFNPTDLVQQNSNNMMAQLQASNNVRNQLSTIKGQISQDVANADLSAMKSYATSTMSHGQDMFVTGFTAPALTQITPDTVTNPLSSDLLGGLTGELSVNSLSEGLMGEGTGDLSGMLEGGLGDLAVAGAGMYISGLTGGAIPPSVASAVVGTAADVGVGIIQGETPTLESVGGSLASNVLGGATGSLIPGGSSAISGVLGSTTGNITSTIATSINGTSLGSGSLTSILGDTTSSSLFADATGGTFEGVVDNVLGDVGKSVVNSTSNGSFSLDNITNAASSLSKSVSGDVLKSVGGVNLSDTSSIMDGIIAKGVDAAKDVGDVFSVSNLIDNFTGDKGLFSSDVINMTENIISNPYNVSNYAELVADVGIDFGSILQTGASYGNSAVKAAADMLLGEETSNYVNGLLNQALNSKLFNKMTTLGDQIAYNVLDSETYKQLDALRDIGEIAMGGNNSTSKYNRGYRNNRKLSNAAEKIFNNGKDFGSDTARSFRFDSDITHAVKKARWLLK